MTEDSLIASDEVDVTTEVETPTEEQASEAPAEEVANDDAGELIFGKFKDMDAATEGYKTLESENGKLRRERAPEAPEVYEYNFTEDNDLKDVVPQDFDFANDPLLKQLEPAFKELNITQEQASKLVGEYLKYEVSLQTNPADELAKLGPNGNQVVEDVKNFSQKHFNEEEQAILQQWATTGEATSLLHKISKMSKGSASIPSGNDGSANTVQKSSDELFLQAQELRRSTKGFEFNSDAKNRYEALMQKAIEAEEKGY